jgi:hypothetical protein
MKPAKKPAPFVLRHWFALLLFLLLLLTLAKVLRMVSVGLPGLLFDIPTLVLLVALLIGLPLLRSRSKALVARLRAWIQTEAQDAVRAMGASRVAEAKDRLGQALQDLGLAEDDQSATTSRFCIACGQPLRPGARFCEQCGQATPGK